MRKKARLDAGSFFIQKEPLETGTNVRYPIREQLPPSTNNERRSNTHEQSPCIKRRVNRRTCHHARRWPVFLCKRREIRRSEEHTSELQSRGHLVCRLLLENKK